MCPIKLKFWLFKIQTGYSFWGAAINRQLIYFWGVAPTTPPAWNTRPELIMLRITGHKFGENNVGVIGCWESCAHQTGTTLWSKCKSKVFHLAIADCWLLSCTCSCFNRYNSSYTLQIFSILLAVGYFAVNCEVDRKLSIYN